MEVLRLNLPSRISSPPWREVIVISCHHNNLIGGEAIELRTACQVWARVFDSGCLMLDRPRNLSRFRGLSSGISPSRSRHEPEARIQYPFS